VISELRSFGASVRQDTRTKLLVVNEKFTIRVGVARCRSLNEANRWLLRIHSPLQPDSGICAVNGWERRFSRLFRQEYTWQNNFGVATNLWAYFLPLPNRAVALDT
jgi:hypothetical protein